MCQCYTLCRMEILSIIQFNYIVGFVVEKKFQDFGRRVLDSVVTRFMIY